MYLEKLEIQGFKSFANKNVLQFPGMLNKKKRGITAVVGPNGSGKSNIADAVRWALGEQSMKTLRGKKSEDIIFSGSDKKGKLGMAEVSLYLNNKDGRAPLDFEQVIITRRLYRNGDSEYLINNSRVRLGDIQMLLAKAKFGQKTYSVIGQGMVEGFLNTSLAERKEFFDEATGVKEFQIKRDNALNKLRNSHENLLQAEMLLNEIEPRLKSLTRQVNRLRKREELEKELKKRQKSYYAVIWQDINKDFNLYNEKFLLLEKEKFAKEKKLSQLQQELEKMKQEREDSIEFDNWQEELTVLRNKKDDLNKKLAKYDAQIEVDLESRGHFDVSFLLNKQAELDKEIKTIKEETSILIERIKNDQAKEKALEQKKKELDDKINNINSTLQKTNIITEDDEKDLNKLFEGVIENIRNLEAESDLVIIKSRLKQVRQEIKKILILSRTKKEQKERIRLLKRLPKELKVLGDEKENLVLKINDNNLRLTARSERIKLLTERLDKLMEERGSLEKKLAQVSGHLDVGEIDKEQKNIKSAISEIDRKIKNINEKIGAYNMLVNDKRRRLFDLQQHLSDLQNEINLQNNELNELKIKATRYETRLEDLEVEIREELGGIKEIKHLSLSDEDKKETTISANKEKIAHLKRQLEQIGGIDPQTEAEYQETKERYDFLISQVSDLTKAVDSLEKIIKELDAGIKERFDKEFKMISKKFADYFKILFNGGRAKIIKVMESSLHKQQEQINKDEKKDNLNASAASLSKVKFLQKHNATGLAGIEIQATPPGKKIQSVTMLSGGERALTAIALICAIISSNPSPFVVLDEVDAALDEANSERLASILDELSHKTQFIVITHNRASMHKANVLYGITMGDDGVSKLLSVKLDEAESVIKE